MKWWYSPVKIILHIEDHCTMREVRRNAAVSESFARTTIKKFIDEGLVHRERVNDRSYCLFLTDKGRRMKELLREFNKLVK